MLAKTVREQPFEWESHLRRLCLAYNTSVNPTTGYSPFFLMFGRQVRMPVDIIYGSPNVQTSTVPRYVADLRSNLNAAYECVRKQMGYKLDRQKEIYDKKVHGVPFQPRDLVWLHSPVVPRGQARKLHHPWTGPYRIVSKLSDAVYRIQHLRVRRKCLVVHFDRLKPCPSDIRLSQKFPQRSRVNDSLPRTPPVGTDLELVGGPDPCCRIPTGNNGMVIQNPSLPSPQETTPTPCSQDSDDVDSTAHPPRYPRRDRTEPDRLYPVIKH
jgi:hypothetical protein